MNITDYEIQQHFEQMVSLLLLFICGGLMMDQVLRKNYVGIIMVAAVLGYFFYTVLENAS
jgi:hypothetical protein